MNFITSTEAAAIMGCTYKTFYERYVKTDKLEQFPKKGTNTKFYDEAAVHQLKEEEHG